MLYSSQEIRDCLIAAGHADKVFFEKLHGICAMLNLLQRRKCSN